MVDASGMVTESSGKGEELSGEVLVSGVGEVVGSGVTLDSGGTVESSGVGEVDGSLESSGVVTDVSGEIEESSGVCAKQRQVNKTNTSTVTIKTFFILFSCWKCLVERLPV